MREGERQVATTLAGIRRDHVARYEWAATVLQQRGAKTAIDFACGVGYGAHILAERKLYVSAYDHDSEALSYAALHWGQERIVYQLAAAESLAGLPPSDAAVCFETVEHIEDPRRLLRVMREAAPLLLISAPNEAEFPYEIRLEDGDVIRMAYHYRHYTQAELTSLLCECGWEPYEWHGQEGEQSEVELGAWGRTIIAVCR